MCCDDPPSAAYVELPDGKVVSGTEWGNLLLWDGGFIKVEISRKNKKFCHQVTTTSLLYYMFIVYSSVCSAYQLLLVPCCFS